MELRENIFILMHKDSEVLPLLLDPDTGSIIKSGDNGKKDLLPPGGRKSPKDLKLWWERRAVPISQGNIQEILERNHFSTPQVYLLKNLGLSLTDHYWIRPFGSQIQWKDVSLFSNQFAEPVTYQEKRESDDMLFQGQFTFVPSASLQGDLEKKWVIAENGERILIKGNYGATCQQSVNEIFASVLHQRQGTMPFAKYWPVNLNNGENQAIGCACAGFTNERLEFIPAIDIVNSEKKPNDMSQYEFFISLCRKNGLEEEKVRNFLEYQIMSDFLITNTDRHLNNFGILRDTDTLKFVSMAPIFDSGNSMFWNAGGRIPGKEEELLQIEVNSFRKTEVDLLEYVQNKKLLDLNLLPGREKLEKLLELGKVEEQRAEKIVTAYRQKADLLEQLQRGQTLQRKKAFPCKTKEHR